MAPLDGTAADLVIGGAQGLGASQMNFPASCWADANHLLVVDSAAHRVLIWIPPPSTNAQPATTLLGWSDFGVGGAATNPPSASSLNFPLGAFFDGTMLNIYVADFGNQRVLAWNGIPSQPRAADLVLGQTSFTTRSNNMGGAVGPAGMTGPHKVLVSRGSLFVTDSGNNRLMIYTPAPRGTGAPGTPAAAVLGAGDLMTAPPTGAGSATAFFGNPLVWA